MMKILQLLEDVRNNESNSSSVVIDSTEKMMDATRLAARLDDTQLRHLWLLENITTRFPFFFNQKKKKFLLPVLPDALE